MSTARRRPYIANQKVAVALGCLGLATAAFCFRDAYERRGRQRPPLVAWGGI